MDGSAVSAPKGIFPILYAFFDDAGDLDHTAFKRQIDVCLESGAHGIAVLGLITEVKALTVDERETLVRWTVERVAGRVPVMATIAGRTLEDVLRLAKAAERIGGDVLVLQLPIGQRPSGPELIQFYSSVMEAIRIDVGIQNAPEFLGVGLSVDEVGALSHRHSNFTLMKGEGPLVQVEPFVTALRGRVAVFNGRGGLELPDNILAGCAGMIPAPDCADIQVRIYDAIIAGDHETAARLYRLALPYIVFAMQSLDVAILYGKRMFARRAGIANSGGCRVPVLQPTPVLEAAMERWSVGLGPYRRW
jgi:4-hydroxy-tetrahydrodipicolinate synthase